MAKTTNGQALIAAAATNTFDAISLKLHNLTEIVKMAAFAAEARRTLGGIQDVARLVPTFQMTLKDETSNPNSWAEFVDNTADVLDYVARQLKQVNGEFTANLYGLADETRATLSEPEKIGGRT